MKAIFATLFICFATQYAIAETSQTLPSATIASDSSRVKKFDKDWLLSLKKPDEGLIKALINYYKLPEPIARIFFCLALSNTKRFKDETMMAANNLYCLCDENNLGRYYQYQHWSESVDDILGIYKQELGKDFNNVTDLLDCITSHYDREKTVEMSKYHELYFGNKLPIRSESDAESKKRKGGLPW